MKRGIAILLTGALCLGLLAGCGNKGNADSSSSKDSKEGEVLSMMLNGAASDAYVEGYQKLIDAFNESNEYGVTIKPEFVSNSDYKTKLTTMMASDSEPDIIFTWELGYLENFVDGEKIENLQKYLDEDQEWADSFNSGTLEQETYDGSVYGIPTAQCMATMYYNKGIFEKYGLSVPTTYDEYRKVCDTLLENGVTPVALASTADDAWLVSQYIQQLSDGIAGNELFEGIKAGTKSWNDDAMVQAAKLFQEEVDAGYFEKGFTGVSGSEAEALFQSGQAAMYFNGTWEISNLNNKDVCQVADDVSCFTMPPVDKVNANVSVGSLDNSFAVTKNCKNVDAAVALLKYWTNADNAAMLLYDYGRMPATKFDLDESKLSSLSKDAITCFNEQTALTPWFDRMNTDLGNEFNNSSIAIANGEDPQATLDNLQKYAEANE
ncbi:ABC transporter substrate-binding protein [Muricomes intestini]|jgi:raffinose/stachyose/melibiose transport system substrate-binding protein|uniref:Carbohydrate ABC transporter substrate-binding protein (CUT1 family) n=1 Tax=Muricomes intestini TaxID=1796634 RepID=A0A4R3K176_9FIRM|nr:extracellular solute-binding protein [Muricomes intestini]TCS74710.1 carbohydrate ABC transporter substrate-binding protein (CUT1 family) [Muricomes intestini]HAX51405.1 hypothetical protein [Lachnospiraceae bacterium]HCR82372.1 hypothetical protein [Lachnospiraceae bacterium]